MNQCEYCGQYVNDDITTCPYCGAPITPVTQTTTTETETTGPYSLILESLNNCTEAAATDLMTRLLGYSTTDADNALEYLPAMVAQKLTYTQAQTIAQTFESYGMTMTIRNGNETVGTETTSDTDKTSLLQAALATLGTLAMTHRMRKFRRFDGIPKHKPQPEPVPQPKPRKVVQRQPSRGMRQFPQGPQSAPNQGARKPTGHSAMSHNGRSNTGPSHNARPDGGGPQGGGHRH